MNHPRPIGERTTAALTLLARLPRFVLVLGVAALTVGGLAVPGVPGALLLGALSGLVAWLAWLSWPTLPDRPGAANVLRLAAAAALLAGAILKLTSGGLAG